MMDWLESKLGRWAIPRLIQGVVFLNAMVFALGKLDPNFISALTLIPSKVMEGQVWRLFTFIAIPPTFSLFWIFFALMFLWMLGEGLEQAWGSFRLNLYFFTGMACTAVAALFTGSADADGVYLAMSLFLAFATLFPNFEIMLFFILPVKVKYLAIFNVMLMALSFFGGGFFDRISILISLGNYFLFFGPQAIRNGLSRRQNLERKKKFDSAKLPDTEAFHRCAQCGKTEQTDPSLEFRVAADGREFCAEHLP